MCQITTIKTESTRLSRLHPSVHPDNKSYHKIRMPLIQIRRSYSPTKPFMFYPNTDQPSHPRPFAVLVEVTPISDDSVLRNLSKSYSSHIPASLQGFNICLSIGTIPHLLISVGIELIPNEGFKDYRPMACFSAISKMFENTLFKCNIYNFQIHDLLSTGYEFWSLHTVL